MSDNKTNDNPFSSTFLKYDFKLNNFNRMGLNIELDHADVHQDKLYLLSTSPDNISKDVYVYDQRLKFLHIIKFGNIEGLPFYVANSVTRMRVVENFFIFLDGAKVLLMDRVDGLIKRTFNITSSDFVLDLSNDRVMAYDGKLGKLFCFNYEGASFEISMAGLKNFELVDFFQDKFMFFDASSFFIYF